MNITPVFDQDIILAVRHATTGVEATTAEIIEKTEDFWFCLPPVPGPDGDDGEAFLVVLDDTWYFLLETIKPGQGHTVQMGETAKPESVTAHVWQFSTGETP